MSANLPLVVSLCVGISLQMLANVPSTILKGMQQLLYAKKSLYLEVYTRFVLNTHEGVRSADGEIISVFEIRPDFNELIVSNLKYTFKK